MKIGEVSDLKEGSYVMIKGEPSVVKNIQMSSPGKHGHAKARIKAVGLIDDKKRIVTKPGDERIDIPIVEKNKAQVVSLSGDDAQCMDLESYENFELEIPDELKDDIEEGGKVKYWDVNGTKMMKEVLD